MDHEDDEERVIDKMKRHWREFVLILGVIVLIPFMFVEFGEDNNSAAPRVLAVTIVMGLYWSTEALPLPVTSLLPIFLFPVLHITPASEVSSLYFNNSIALFVASNILALAMAKYNLHKRIALSVLLLVGPRPRLLILGFMLMTAFLSSFMNNNSTVTVMAPLVISLVSSVRSANSLEQHHEEEEEEELDEFVEDQHLSPLPLADQRDSPEKPPTLFLDFDEDDPRDEHGIAVKNFALACLLGTAYSSSAGGAGTLIGSSSNLAFVSNYESLFPNGPEISFSSWMLYAFPFACVFVVIEWMWLMFMYLSNQEIPLNIDILRREHRHLGPIKCEEFCVALCMGICMCLWLTRTGITGNINGWGSFFEEGGTSYVLDGTVGVGVAILLFTLPTFPNRDGNSWNSFWKSFKGCSWDQRMLNWKDMKEISWGVVLLLGAGFSIANAFSTSGLSQMISNQLSFLDSFPPFPLLFVVCLFVSFLTEAASNVAIMNIIVSILSSMAISAGQNPLFLLIPSTVACKFAFMLPVATPPNAIVFAYGVIKVKEMVRAGFMLDIIGVVALTTWSFFMLPLVFGIELNTIPEWALIPSPSPFNG